MRGSYLRKIIFLFSIFLLITYSGLNAYAYSELPEKVRIGLYFSDAKTNQYTALSSFNIDCDNGLELGCSKDDTFTSLVEGPAKNAVTIRKDAFFVNDNGKLTEYNPSSGKIPEGEKIGAYHIQIESEFTAFEQVDARIKELAEKGVTAYPVYVDSWQIWTGFFISEADAKKAIEDSINPELQCVVVHPSPTRIAALSKSGQVMLMFDSQTETFMVRPNPESTPQLFRINNDDKKTYRGEIEVRRLSGSDMTVINVLPLEEYLYGVVPYEIGSSSHPEALKAQAVSARTYTINNLSKYSRLNFNLCTTVNSQVYKGYSGETPATNKAIDDTKGEIVTYNGKPASVFYFSSSGGRTEDVKNVWGSDNFPYLKSVEDNYESGKSWNYTWEKSYTAEKIKEVMNGRGFKLGNILGIYITKKSEAGRATELVVKGTGGERVYTNGGTRSFLSFDSQWYTITTDADLTLKGIGETQTKSQLAGRQVMTGSGLKTISTVNKNASVVSSGNVKSTVPLVPTLYIFMGRGWGHGVGMSQEGAKGMANEGFTYDEILTHYFTGTEVE